jgi:hypothetical protein
MSLGSWPQYFAPYIRVHQVLPTPGYMPPVVIQSSPFAAPNDGDMFTMRLGDGTAVVFEFDDDASTVPGNIPVDISNPFDDDEQFANIAVAFYNAGLNENLCSCVQIPGYGLRWTNCEILSYGYGVFTQHEAVGAQHSLPVCPGKNWLLPPFIQQGAYYPPVPYEQPWPIIWPEGYEPD